MNINSIIVIALSILILIGVMVYLYKNAPEGYEDEKGFHYGRKDDEDGKL